MSGLLRLLVSLAPSIVDLVFTLVDRIKRRKRDPEPDEEEAEPEEA